MFFLICLTGIGCHEVVDKLVRTEQDTMKLDSIKLKELYTKVFNEHEIDMDKGEILNPGKVYYSPDFKFKIFSFEGESCGIYCNAFYENFIDFHSEGNSNISIKNIKKIQGKIDSLIQLDSISYLVFTNYAIRPRSIESIDCKVVYQLKLGKTYPSIWELKSCGSNLASDDDVLCELIYDKTTKSILYKYQMYEEDDPTSTYMLSGKWKYVNGNYIESEKRREVFLTEEAYYN